MLSSKLFAAYLTIAVASVVGAPSTSLGAGQVPSVAVVVSSDLPVDDISFGDLKRLYRGNPIVAGGKQLVPLTYRKESPERRLFDRAVLGMSPDDAARYWIDRKIRGQSGQPKALESPEVLVRVVSKVDGAIGFVKGGTAAAGVKVLRIDGKRPGEPGYPINI
jgi:hypothetical protein